MTISTEDNLKLSQLFYYLQDISLELQADFGIIQLVDATLNIKGCDFFIEYEELITMKITKANNYTLFAMAKVAFHNMILNICRFAEAIQKSGSSKLLIKYCPKSHKRFNNFISEHYTEDIRKYRNCYAAHPIDNSTKEFTPRSELLTLCERILNISSIKEIKSIDFIEFLKDMHFINESNPDKSLTNAIYNMSIELKQKDIILNRI